MDYPDEREVEDMDTSPSPMEVDIVTETTEPEVITIKEEQIEACELLDEEVQKEQEEEEEEKEEEEEEEEEQQFTETEKQVTLPTKMILQSSCFNLIN